LTIEEEVDLDELDSWHRRFEMHTLAGDRTENLLESCNATDATLCLKKCANFGKL